ncbi:MULTISPECIES: GIY-YIG nuclease family protein [unclassified Paraburkholderia]|uniref:GIY-YIG nuclease family protein n=1 Tax=unclassified Paraburkholderia TaxID=2615204 RepID=UPI001613E649|nr:MULTISPECIES: GIY-YIG nuclease family protein [unclassified Paraburkholderia]MBB5444642.1 hypothetical protein [Paraburkholderia sp. WSM4177]MBB5485467.1 hypothetical protein [Paraburkholderia sp. WSM4180]
MQRPTNIYLLRDPRTSEVRYVGKTVRSIESRLRGHISDSRRQKIRVSRWIASLLAIDMRPLVELIEVAHEDWQERERHWISFYRSADGTDNLTNHTDGGEGAPGFVPSEETRLKLSVVHKSRYESVEERRRTGDLVKIALSDPNWKARQSAKQRALWADPTQRMMRVAAQKEASSTPEMRRKKSEAAKKSWTPERKLAESDSRRQRALNQWADPERRAAHSEKLKQICASEEAKNRLASARTACQSPEAAAKRIAWWTPERRAAKGQQLKEAKARKAKNDSQSDKTSG